jgi:SAM-dependent methyltransferase
MPELAHSSQDLQHLYQTRFAGKSEYRQALWRVLAGFFSRWIAPNAHVLDLGAGYCEFINAVVCNRKTAMDLNPDTRQFAGTDVRVLFQDCSERWDVEAEAIDVVFTSNFFEHLPSKASLERTLREAYRALSPGGRLIAMGPNIRYLPGAYWDFFDHYIPLTDLSLIEVLRKCAFDIEASWDRFLPYTMSHGREPALWLVKAYLALPFAWRFQGRQFLVVATKPRG